MQQAPRSASVEYVGISKDFGANRVLSDVSFQVRPGTVKALLGANGSGKSTLIKILAGYYEPTEGDVLVFGDRIDYPIAAHELADRGVRFLHQDLGLVLSLSIADNLALNTGYPMRAGGIDWQQQYRDVRSDLAKVGLEHLDPRTAVRDLGPVEQTLLAMARALRGLSDADGGLLVLDEPTARLPRSEVDALLARCRVLREHGVSMIYVSHRLDEVFALADEVVVMRDGFVKFDGPIADITPASLTSLITGQAHFADHTPTTETAVNRLVLETDPVLQLEDVCGARTRGVSFSVFPGEIVAITGLVGSGKSEVGRMIFGSQPRESGELRIGGRAFAARTGTDRRVAEGVAYVPQERRDGGFPTWDLIDNTIIGHLSNVLGGLRISKKRSRRATRSVIDELDVRPGDPDAVLNTLSGGNQQKVIVGKWLSRELRLMVLDEPTYGVDIGARTAIMNVIRQRTDAGLGVLLIDSDIDLVSQVADRVLIMRHGSIVAELLGDDINAATIAQHSYAVEGYAATDARTSN